MRLREAHGHLGMLGESLRQPNLSACGSVGECLDVIGRAVAGVERGGWLLVRGARVEGWAERRWPTLGELDGVSGAVPVVVMSFDHHMAMGNSAALAGAGLRTGVPVPPNGVVCVDGRGRATGVLMEQAAVAAWNAAPQPSMLERVEQVRAGAEHLHAMGFVEVHDLHTPEWMPVALAQLDRAGELPVSVRLYPPFSRIEAEAARAGGYESRQVRLAGGKLFADGTLNSQTALMLEPYAGAGGGGGGSGEGGCGVAMHTVAEIESAIARCDAVGKHLAVHAIGDGAVRMVLDCFEHVRPRASGGRIEHCELVDEADVPRFKRLGVACSVQPCHLLADIEVLQRTLAHVERKVLPLRDLLATGLEPGSVERGIVFGSDVPIVRAEPEDSIQAAVERGRVGSGVAINPGQAISPEQAWDCFVCKD
ncbi:MAG: amidohydrolase family protein [Phycisphaerales bacterium]